MFKHHLTPKNLKSSAYYHEICEISRILADYHLKSKNSLKKRLYEKYYSSTIQAHLSQIKNLYLVHKRMNFGDFDNSSSGKPVISYCSIVYFFIYMSSFINLAHAWFCPITIICSRMSLSLALQTFPEWTNPECNKPNLFSEIYEIIPNVKILNFSGISIPNPKRVLILGRGERPLRALRNCPIHNNPHHT